MRSIANTRLWTVFAVSVAMLIPTMSAFAQEPACSGCHADMAAKPLTLPESPPADLLEALTTPCFNYGRALEEYYYIEELFVTIERHLVELEEARYHVEPMYEELIASRNYYRTIKNEPLVSLTDFRQKSGKLRFDLGKIYRVAKEHQIDRRNRDVLGFGLLASIFLLVLVVTGWRVSAGRGTVHETKTTLGYDDLMAQGGIEKLLEEKDEEKEDAK